MSKEQTYTIDELSAAAESAFNTKPEVVYAALVTAGKKEATKLETEKLVKKFLDKEVTE